MHNQNLFLYKNHILRLIYILNAQLFHILSSLALS